MKEMISGKWGKPSKLPVNVHHDFSSLRNPQNDADWITTSADGQDWLIARLWHDPEGFRLVACQIIQDEEVDV